MNLSDFVHEELILLDLLSTTKGDIIKVLVSALAQAGFCNSEKTLGKVIMNREALGSTGIGSGVAVPHGKHFSVKEKVMVLGRTKTSIDFDSVDGKPVNLFFMIVSPDTEPGEHLKMLAKISRLLQNEDFREKLMILPTPQQIMKFIKAEEIKK